MEQRGVSELGLALGLRDEATEAEGFFQGEGGEMVPGFERACGELEPGVGRVSDKEQCAVNVMGVRVAARDPEDAVGRDNWERVAAEPANY